MQTSGLVVENENEFPESSIITKFYTILSINILLKTGYR